MDMTDLHRADWRVEAIPGAFFPECPVTIGDSGLPAGWLNQLVLRHLYGGGEIDVARLSARLHLSGDITRHIIRQFQIARLVEPVGRHPDSGECVFRLSDLGRARAAESTRRSAYVGPAPVSLDSYRASLSGQSSWSTPQPADLAHALSDLAVDESTVNQLGAALASQRSFVVVGPRGSGRSSLVGRLAAISRGTVWIPHALLAGDQVIRVLDPLVHQPADPQASSAPDDPVKPSDPRWRLCLEPVVRIDTAARGAELGLHRSTDGAALEAPAHVKAALGTLIVDDAGQGPGALKAVIDRVAPAIERGIDSWVTPGNQRIDMPIRLRLIAVDGARIDQSDPFVPASRWGAPVVIGALSEPSYRRALEIALARVGALPTPEFVQGVLEHHAQASDIPRLASIPDALTQWIAHDARWRGQQPVYDRDTLERAWRQVFPRTLRETPL